LDGGADKKDCVLLDSVLMVPGAVMTVSGLWWLGETRSAELEIAAPRPRE
jgi:hypothetical protein